MFNSRLEHLRSSECCTIHMNTKFITDFVRKLTSGQADSRGRSTDDGPAAKGWARGLELEGRGGPRRRGALLPARHGQDAGMGGAAGRGGMA